MARVYREVQETPNVAWSRPLMSDGLGVIERLVYIVFGVIIALLGLRFLLALLGANPNNSFAHFVYSVSKPFAQPFFGLFNYHTQFGISRFEYETLIAIVVYAFLAWLIAQVISIGRGR